MRTPKRTVADPSSSFIASAGQKQSPGGRVLKVEQATDESNAPLRLRQLHGKSWEEVYQIFIEAAGDSTARLTAVQTLVTSHSKRGGKEISSMIDQILEWGWEPNVGQLESKALLANTVSTTR
jgi:hypothetical protein